MLKRKKKIIAKVMATTMLATTLATTLPISASALEPRSATVSSSILAGDDRYETAVRVSENGWSSATNAVIINGDKGLVDALTATPYASLKDAPILITQKDKLTATTKARLTKLGVKNVSIVGGEAVVSKGVENELKAMGITVTRIKGDDRYLTAVAVANEMHKISSVTKVAVVNGATGLPDAVSIAAPAADNKMPILLSDPKNGMDASKTFMNGKSIYRSYVVGQTDSVSDSVMNSLPGTKTRLGGDDRHDTNTKVIREFYTKKELDNIYVAKSGYVKNNEELVDALAVGVLAAKNDDPVVIVGKSLANSQNTLLREKSFTKITQVGNGIPSASIDGIKDTQKDPEARVNNVTLVDYKTVKLTGSELNRISSSDVSMSGNYVTSYSANSTGTEATVVFRDTFNNGTNTITVKSNLGNSTNHTFTYGAEINNVQAVTKEVKPSGIQYLKFTINGNQERSIEELKSLGWTVEFKSSTAIFYNEANPASNATTTSKTGKLMTSGDLPSEFIYEVVLTKGSTTLKSEKQVVSVKAESNLIKEIKSYDRNFTGTRNGLSFEGSKMLVGESIDIANLKLVKQNGTEQTLATSSDIIGGNVEITSSNPSVLIANGTSIRAGAEGSATITIKAGNISKQFSVAVLKASTNVRVPSNATFYLGNNAVSNVNMISDKKDLSVKVKVIDQLGDPIKTGFNIKKPIETTYFPVTAVADVSETSEFNSKGEATLKITSCSVDQVGTGLLKIQKSENGTMRDIANLNVSVSKEYGNTSYRMDIPTDKDYVLDRYYPKQDSTKQDDNLTVTVNELSSNGYVKGPKDISDNKYTIEVLNGNGIASTNLVDVKKGTAKGTIEVKTVPNDVTGSVTIRLYENNTVNGVNQKTQIGSNIYINVNDSTPTISDIKVNELPTITKFSTDATPEFKLDSLFDITYVKLPGTTASDTNKDDELKFKKVVSGIRLNGYQATEVLVSINSTDPTNPEATFFIDEDNDGKYTEKTDLILSTVNVELSNIVETSPKRTDYTKIKLMDSQKGKVGHIIARLYNGAYSDSKTPFRNISINVNIPNN